MRPEVGSGNAAWDELARRAATPEGQEGASQDHHQLLTFRLEGAPYALPVERVREIVRIRPITAVPRLPHAVRGVISLRGEIVQVVDLRRRLGLAAGEPGRASRVIVVQGEDGRTAGLLVDAVTEVLSVSEESLRPAGAEAGAVDALCVHGEDFVSVVDLDRVLAIDAEQ